MSSLWVHFLILQVQVQMSVCYAHRLCYAHRISREFVPSAAEPSKTAVLCEERTYEIIDTRFFVLRERTIRLEGGCALIAVVAIPNITPTDSMSALPSSVNQVKLYFFTFRLLHAYLHVIAVWTNL